MTTDDLIAKLTGQSEDPTESWTNFIDRMSPMEQDIEDSDGQPTFSPGMDHLFYSLLERKMKTEMQEWKKQIDFDEFKTWLQSVDLAEIRPYEIMKMAAYLVLSDNQAVKIQAQQIAGGY